MLIIDRNQQDNLIDFWKDYCVASLSNFIAWFEIDRTVLTCLKLSKKRRNSPYYGKALLFKIDRYIIWKMCSKEEKCLQISWMVAFSL